MAATQYAPAPTWHPCPEALHEGHIVHTRAPVPQAWVQDTTGKSPSELFGYTPAEREAVLAHHEAGHAIVWELLGIPVEHITHGGVEGYENLGAATCATGDSHLLAGVLIGLAAGHVAEARFIAEAGLYTPKRAWAAQ